GDRSQADLERGLWGAASARACAVWGVELGCPTAHARVRKDEIVARSSFMIAREVGDDAAHLLVAGECEEGRRASVRFRSNDEEVLLGLRELARARCAH